MDKRYAKFMPLVTLALVACTEDNAPRPEIPDMSGKEVSFSLKVPMDSRTYYGQDSWNPDAAAAEIFWGNPFKSTDEEVIVYGKYAGRNVGHYTVSGYGTPSSSDLNAGNNEATTLTKQGETGVQWGEKPADDTAPVTFFSVYPANSGSYMNQGDPANGVLRTQLIPLQSPEGYNIDASDLQPARTPSNVRTIEAYPDMRGAVMVAKTDAMYGAEAVDLNYKVITNVLDITINGPAWGLVNASAPYVDIYSVRISSKSGTPVAGVFDYNIGDESTTVVNGNTAVTLQFGATVQSGSTTGIVYPRLFNHTSGSTSAETVDKLRLRAFLLPGVSPGDLDIYVETNLGYYQLEADKLGNLNFVNGQIHRLKLPLLDQAGLHDFDYSRWMEQIDPAVYATELSIPGSWNSFQLVSGGTNSGTVGDAVQGYQVTDYLDQYTKGVRAFVLRVAAFSSTSSTASTDPAGSDVRVQTGWAWNRSNYGYTLNEVLNNLGAKVAGTKEFVVLILRGPGTPPYVTFDRVKAVLDANQYVYKGEITPETTVGDLAGKIVIKSNVQKRDDAYSGTVPSVGDNFPSMFSEWAAGTNEITKTVPLDWGAWTEGNEGQEDIAGNTGLRWCFTECDNVVLEGTSTVHANVSTVSQREAAVDAYIAKSLTEFQRKEHDTWMYLVIGGNLSTDVTLTGYKASNCAAQVTSALNAYAYGKLAVSDRQACPMGIVMMNFASSTNATYSSANLIRTIINNNNTFVMQKRAGSGDTNEPETPAGYTSMLNGGSAISPASSMR